MTHLRRRLHRAAISALALLVLLGALNVVQPLVVRAGQPLYPDLRTRTPDNLQFDTEVFADGRTHYVLRFDNVVENHGGRLEITADLNRSRDIYQNIYDAPTGGNLVETRRVTSDLIFHPTHNHFHVTDFARYALYKKSSSGAYRQTTRKGTKTSFCILDSVQVDPAASQNSAYDECTRSRQGLSAGWGDLYSAGLPEQWVDLGTKPLADGEYALHSTADPFNRIKESDDGNNTAVRQFRVENGRIVDGGQETSYCSAKPASASPGEIVYVTCDRLSPGATFDVRWRYTTGSPLASAPADENGELHASFVMPPTARGARYVIISAGDGSKTLRAVVDVVPSLALDSSTGYVGDRVGFQLRGFNPDEQVTLTYPQTVTVTKSLVTVRTDANGSANGTAVVPSSSAGEHPISALGTGGKPATATFNVLPTLRLSVSSGTPGTIVQPTLRGFGNRERVSIRLVETNTTLRLVTVSSTGALNASPTWQFAVPANLAPGVYTILAVGRTSGIQTTVPFTVTGVQSAESPPTPASTAEPAPPATPVPEPSPAATTELAPTVEPTMEPVADSAPTEVPAPSTEPDPTVAPPPSGDEPPTAGTPGA